MTARNTTVATGAAIVAALLLLPSVGQGAFQSPGARMSGRQELPPGVTAEKIATGKDLFQTEKCAACHGTDANGKPRMTDSLTDTTWEFAEGGAYPALVKVLTEGLTPAQTKGLTMRNAVISKLSDEQVQALAAYVWSLSR